MQLSQRRIKAAIFGGSGYGGSELLRILLFHPHVDVVLVTANEHADKRVAEVHRNLHGLTDLSFVKQPETLDGVLDDVDCVFFALPHGQAMSLVPNIPPQIKVIDLSGDFRLRDQSLFESHYKQPHTAMDTQAGFVYGLTETNREAVRHARLIANPGCFATATLLASVPLLSLGLTSPTLFVSGITGSTGSGRKPVDGTHHPVRHSDLYSYSALSHRHAPEIAACARAASGIEADFAFVPHSGPFARGIHVTVQAPLKSSLDTPRVLVALRDFYAHAPFVRVTDQAPRVKEVATTSYAHLSAVANGRTVAVMCAIDNLNKGAAGGAVQWMNRMFGLPETAGLMAPAPGWT